MARTGALLLIALAVLLPLPNLLPSELTARLPSFWQPIGLGLDLAGGAALRVEIDTTAAEAESLRLLHRQALDLLRDRNIAVSTSAVAQEGVRLGIVDPNAMETALPLLADAFPDAHVAADSRRVARLALRPEAVTRLRRGLAERTAEVLRRRIDALGVREPAIAVLGTRGVHLALPGTTLDQAEALVTRGGRLSLHLVARPAAAGTDVPADQLLLPNASGDGGPSHYLVSRTTALTGDLLDSATVAVVDGRAAVRVAFAGPAGARFAALHEQNIGRQLAYVIDGRVISAPRMGSLGGRQESFVTGAFDTAGARDLAVLLGSGALPAELRVTARRAIGPELGADSIRAGTVACLAALAFLLALLSGLYGAAGALLFIALSIHLGLLLGLLGLLGAALTLPGLAGLALGLGMAVDAGVIVLERRRLGAEADPFRAALPAVLDAQVTTALAAGILFALGPGPVRGFAITLGLGLVTGVMATFVVFRMMMAWRPTRRAPTRQDAS